MVIGFAAAVGVLLCASPVLQPEIDEQGHSLEDRWEMVWHRIFDRTGRPDSDGPMLQQLPEHDYLEYVLNLSVPAFKRSTEHAWVKSSEGARLWVQSLDEFMLANRAQIKTRAPMGGGWHLNLHYDRLESLTHASDLLEATFTVDDIANTNLFGSISLFSRWEKDDTDGGMMIGYRQSGWGEVRLRLFSLDTFVNASMAIFESRGGEREVHTEQQDLPFAMALEIISLTWHGARVELYGGTVIPQHTLYRYPDDNTRDNTRRREGILGGGLVDWRPFDLPVHVGASVLAARTQMTWNYETVGTHDERADETLYELDVYGVVQPLETLHLEASLTGTWRSEERQGATVAEMNTAWEDEEWVWLAQGVWMPIPVFGVEIGLMGVIQPEQDGSEAVGTRHETRLTTRFVLFLGNVWTAFGVGWDLDEGDGPYDGGGMTMTVSF